MPKDNKTRLTLTDEDMVTSPKLTRRSLLASAGVALGTAAVAGRSALAADGDETGDKAEGDKASDDKGDKAEGDKGDKAEGDKEESKIEYGRDKD